MRLILLVLLTAQFAAAETTVETGTLNGAAFRIELPANWKDGDDVIIPLTIQDEAVIKQKFPKGYKAPRPYLRITPQPNK